MSERKSYSILMVNLPFSGHTNPTLGLARMLTEMGHRVTYVHSPTWREAVENTGVRFVPYDDYSLFPSPFQDRMRCWRAAYRTVLPDLRNALCIRQGARRPFGDSSH